jgi:hypothetical protein
MPTAMRMGRRTPATAIRTAAREVAAEFPADVLIVAIAMAIVGAIYPDVAPAMAMMPHGAMASRCVCMAAVPGFADAPLASLAGSRGRGLGRLVGGRRGRGWLRRCRRWRCIFLARLGLGLRDGGGCGEPHP